jgi:hypothetical protein
MFLLVVVVFSGRIYYMSADSIDIKYVRRVDCGPRYGK